MKKINRTVARDYSEKIQFYLYVKNWALLRIFMLLKSTQTGPGRKKTVSYVPIVSCLLTSCLSVSAVHFVSLSHFVHLVSSVSYTQSHYVSHVALVSAKLSHAVSYACLNFVSCPTRLCELFLSLMVLSAVSATQL